MNIPDNRFKKEKDLKEAARVLLNVLLNLPDKFAENLVQGHLPKQVFRSKEKQLLAAQQSLADLNKQLKIQALKQNLISLQNVLKKVIEGSISYPTLSIQARSLGTLPAAVRNSEFISTSLKRYQEALEEYIILGDKEIHSSQGNSDQTLISIPKQPLENTEVRTVEKMKLFASPRFIREAPVQKTKVEQRQEELMNRKKANERTKSNEKNKPNDKNKPKEKSKPKRIRKVSSQEPKNVLSPRELENLKKQRLSSEGEKVFEPLLKNAFQNPLTNTFNKEKDINNDTNNIQSQSNQENWLPFLKTNVSKKLKNEKKLLLSIETKATPRTFDNICKKLAKKVANYPGDEEGFTFGKLELTKKIDSQHETYHLHSKNQEQSIVKIAHLPENNKIDIVLTDMQAGDEGLFLMVISVKKILKELGKSEFNIENCEENPLTAVKLYLIGKGLGLNPIFKDRKDQEGKTLESIKNAQMKLKLGDEQKTLFEFYKEIEAIDANNSKQLVQLKHSIKNLQMEYLSTHSKRK